MKNILKFAIVLGVLTSLFSCGTEHITFPDEKENDGSVIYVSPVDATAAVQMADNDTSTTGSAL